DWNAAEREYQLAFDSPTAPDTDARETHALFLAAVRGRMEDAVAEARRSVEADPLSAEAGTILGYTLLLARRFDEAIAQLRQTVEMEPQYWYGRTMLARAYAQAGRLDDAISEAEAAKNVDPNAEALAVLGWVLGRAGRRDAAMRVADELRERSQQEY